MSHELTSLRPLRDVIRDHNLRAEKRLGQHFLLDTNLLSRIVSLAGDLTGRTVLEIGPGPGGLTRALLASGASHVVAIERDPRCIEALQELVMAFEGQLTLIEADAMEVDLAMIRPEQRLTIVANLPYNVGTALLLRWLDQLVHIESMTLMFQREVADRLIAQPRSKDYGRLSVLVQWLCTTERLLHLPAKAFVPPPKVASSIIGLTPRDEPLEPADKRLLERILAAAFGQRRKMLRTSLKPLIRDPRPLLAAAGLDETARAEELDVESFCHLARQAEADGNLKIDPSTV
ncbi:MAG: 16S rRNA (adenine(1518)-N(6)/adenine(1519)-N(6))-dimethyltransferase RsmA [Pseudomonadota bacterium]